jgi:hypothetical protein
MTNRFRRFLLATFMMSGVSTLSSAQDCASLRVDQETYVSVSERVYVYVPMIDGTSRTSNSFTMRVLIGHYGRPFLLRQGFMRESDVDKLLAEHRDIRQYTLRVSGYSRQPAGSASSVPKSYDVDGTLTIRVLAVSDSDRNGSNNSVQFEACPSGGVIEALTSWRWYWTGSSDQFATRWRSLTTADERIVGTEPRECHLWPASKGQGASCDVEIKKENYGHLKESNEEVYIKWVYTDVYSQTVRLSVLGNVSGQWRPEEPSIDPAQRQKREGYQRQIRQALLAWNAELKSGVTSRVVRAAPQLRSRATSEEVVSVFCDVRASAEPPPASCRIHLRGTGPVPKGTKNTTFYREALQEEVDQELSFSQAQGGTLVPTPVQR